MTSQQDKAEQLVALKNLVTALETTNESVLDETVAPVMDVMRDETKKLVKDLKNAVSYSSEAIKDFSNWVEKPGRKKEGEHNSAVIDLLVATIHGVVSQLDQHSTIMGAMLAQHEKDISVVKKENVTLEIENDEIRQRSMKGNLIISSSTQGDRTSAFQRLPAVGDPLHRETDLEMVLRLVEDKTGVKFHEEEVEAFHPLSRRGEGGQGASPTSYVLRIWNRKPGTAWDALREGMRTGRKAGNLNENFSQLNLNVNYQLTRPRGKLAQAVRQARTQLIREKKLKKEEKVFKYSHDENGVLRVKCHYGRAGRWAVVSTLPELQHYIQLNYSTIFHHVVEG
jgi:hypothetical protein